MGAPGMEEYTPQFAGWAGQWQEACQKGGATYQAVGLDASETASDRDQLEKALADMSRVK